MKTQFNVLDELVKGSPVEDNQEGYWRVYSYDITNGEVNDIHKTSHIVDLPFDSDSTDIVKELVKMEYLSEKGGNVAVLDNNCDGNTLYFNNKKTGKPLFEIRWEVGGL